MTVVAGVALATASCSDYSDYNTVPADANASAGNTLFENIKGNANLQNFASIIEKAGYASVLNSSQCYTLWAPVDGTYDAAAILAMDSAKIVDRFINQHIAQYSYPVSGTIDERVITLNDKHHTFTNALFDESKVQDVNLPASNGIMHTIQGNSQYLPSIYESLNELQGSDNLVKFIKDYDTKYIDLRNSVKGPMVNGQQTYLDTVWKTTNPVVKRILRADIEDEDSSYVMLMPTDEAWTKGIERVKKGYNYATGFKYMDVATITTAAASIKAANGASKDAISINAELYTDSLPKYWMTRNLVYSLSHDCNSPILDNKLRYPEASADSSPADSLLTTTGNKITNVSELLSHCGEPVKMSNGYTRTLDSLIFKPYESYERVLTFRSPYRTLGLGDKSASSHSMLKTEFLETYGEDILSELPDFLKARVLPKNSNYVQWIACDSINFASQSVKPEIDFALHNVLSEKYKIYVVFCPISYNKTGDKVIKAKPYYARFDLAYNKANGAQDYYRLNVEGAKSTADIVIPDNGKFNYVELNFEFPISYFGIDAFPTLLVSNTKAFTTTSNRQKFEQELRIQGIYLVPEGALDYFKNTSYK